MNRISISIVTPSYNQGDFLEDCMTSVLNQGYPNLEYIVIDGGSHDRSPQIINRYKEQLSYSVSESDKGHADAINKGFKQSSGEVMAWLNSDDMYLPWTLKVVADIFEQFPEVEWITGLNGTWNQYGAITEVIKSRKNIYDYLLGDYVWIQQESVFWRRSLWEKAGGQINESIRYMVDGELWTRFFQHAELYHVDCLFGGYRKHGSNRGVEFVNECHKEMVNSISRMKENVSSDVLMNADKLAFSKQCLAAPIPGRWGYLYPLLKKMGRTAFAEAHYKDISFQDGQWQLKQVPYEIKLS
ncbi:MAG: glycosyl transferase [Puniceicoccaceae bacterium]|nr:glycosyl transferase [Puniceicoccaceae bacterium]|tara:strand:+ start:63197 stop:64093 length:897 start_codon:yes stop_codon:yes gene_type:complete